MKEASTRLAGQECPSPKARSAGRVQVGGVTCEGPCPRDVRPFCYLRWKEWSRRLVGRSQFREGHFAGRRGVERKQENGEGAQGGSERRGARETEKSRDGVGGSEGASDPRSMRRLLRGSTQIFLILDDAPGRCAALVPFATRAARGLDGTFCPIIRCRSFRNNAEFSS